MNIPAHYSLIEEHKSHFEIHDSRDGRKFKIAKKDLEPGIHSQIENMPKFDDGGAVQPASASPGESQSDMAAAVQSDIANGIRDQYGNVIPQKGSPQESVQTSQPMTLPSLSDVASGSPLGLISSGISNAADWAAQKLANTPGAPVELQNWALQHIASSQEQAKADQNSKQASLNQSIQHHNDLVEQINRNAGKQVYQPLPTMSASGPQPASVGASDSVGTSQSSPLSSGTANAMASQPDVLGDGLQEARDAIQAGAEAEGNVGQQTSDALQTYLKNQQQLQTSFMDDFKKRQEADSKLQQAYAAQTINPKQIWQNASTGQKIAAGIGLLFGGMGAAKTGQPNWALESINNAINREMEAQKLNQGQAYNLWQMNRAATNSDMEANLAFQNQALSSVKAQIQQYSAQAAGPEAKARIAPALLQIDQQMMQNNLRRSLMSGYQGGNSMDVDPAQLVPLMPSSPETQQKALDEIGAAQNTSKNAPAIIQAFDRAAHNYSHAADYIPGVENVDQKSMHALLGPTFKDVDGTVRQAAMDNLFKSVTPQFGDNANTIAGKRASLIGYLQSKQSAPFAKSMGLDLSKFRSTRMGPSYSPGQIVSVRGQTYKVGPDGNQLIPLNGVK